MFFGQVMLYFVPFGQFMLYQVPGWSPLMSIFRWFSATLCFISGQDMLNDTLVMM
jgi:hypothetical protein